MNGDAVGINVDAFLAALPTPSVLNWFFDLGQRAKNRVDADGHPGRRSANIWIVKKTGESASLDRDSARVGKDEGAISSRPNLRLLAVLAANIIISCIKRSTAGSPC